MLLNDLGDYLSSGGIGTVGTDLFLGTLPTAPDNAVAIYETGGLGAIHAMNPNAGQAKVERPRIQVVSRGGANSYEAARAVAQKAWLLLDGLPTRTINGTQYHWGACVQSPFLMGRDEPANRPLIAFNVDLVKALSSTS